ncbi:AraC family ligand binding domain-containing protein [Rhodococcus erythropolis]|nr:AraC family ligand binding domain-containing protein [Rhodococcus erythropolis]
MSRRRMLSAFKAGAQIGNYEDEAVLPVDVDPQIMLSRNWLTQPFYQLFEHDTIVVQMSGAATVRLQNSSVNTFHVRPGDHVYVPAGTPHRIEPIEEGVQLRYMAADAGLEGAAWYCEKCDAEVHRLEWTHDHDAHAPRVYATACARFSADLDARTCSQCGTVAPEIDLSRLGWDHLVAPIGEPNTAAGTLVDHPA